MALYDLVRDLPLVVERYELEGHEYPARADFLRRTTVIRLSGAGDEGLGEDVTYDGDLQEAQQARGALLPLAGEWTLDGFSHHLETVGSALGRRTRIGHGLNDDFQNDGSQMERPELRPKSALCMHFSVLAGPHPRSLSLGGVASRRFLPAPRSGRRRFPGSPIPANNHFSI